MSNNNRDDSEDSQRTEMDLGTDSRDDGADRSHRDDSQRTEMDLDTDSRDDGVDRDYRDDDQRTEMDMHTSNHDDTADHGRRDDTMDHDHRDDTADHGRRDGNEEYETNPGERGKWLSPLIALLGLWMIGLAFVLDVTGSHFWSAVLVGALLVGVGAYNYSRRGNERVANSAIALIAVAAGLWLIAAPYVLGGDAGLTESAYDLWFYNHIAVGLLAAGLGAYSAYMARDHQQDSRQTNA